MERTVVELIAVLGGSWLIQFALALRYRAAVRTASSEPAVEPTSRWPRIGVHRPLRGADPHLVTAIESLLD